MDKCTIYVYKSDKLGSEEEPIYGFFDGCISFMPNVCRTLATLAAALYKKMKERYGEADPSLLLFRPPPELARRDKSEKTVYRNLDQEEIAIFFEYFKE